MPERRSITLLCSIAIAGPKEDALQPVGQWAQALTDFNVHGIVKLYAPDALFLGTGSKTMVTTPEATRTYFERALLRNRPRGATLGEPAVMVVCDPGVVVTGVETVTSVREGTPVSGNGRVTVAVAKRGSDWHMVHFHRSAGHAELTHGSAHDTATVPTARQATNTG